jgi:3-oxoacyl-[acyl-carrier protein] reductase
MGGSPDGISIRPSGHPPIRRDWDMTNIDLTGKVALVTGGSRGIGKSIVEGLAGAGARVALCGRDGAKAQAVAAELGAGARGYACDMTVAEQIEALAGKVEAEVGPVDILVNNAGVTKDNLLFRIGADDWDLVLNANLKGPFLLTKLLARGMIKRRWGRIVNIASVVGMIGNKGQANYAAAKAGLIGFTKAVARELASRNVLVNAVAPGYIDTDMTRAIADEAKQALQAAIPLGKLGSGADVAGAVLFLASDLASYITGQVLVVDGGMVM